MIDARIVAAAPELSFSEQPGYEPQRFDYECPITALPCLEKLSLISTYTRDIDEATVRRGDADTDIWKLNVKLREYEFWALTGADCASAGRCAIRKAMNESAPRQAAVKGIRGLRELFR